jgi:serine protease AprX
MAAAPARHLDDLEDGTALLKYEPALIGDGVLGAQLGDTGVGLLRNFDGLDVVAVRGTARQLRAAASLPAVTGAQTNARLRFYTYQSSPLVYRGAQRRMSLFDQGFNGAGVTVAVVDSGTFGLHPDLAKRMKKNVKFENATGAPVECPGTGQCQTDTSSGHGTHVSGTVVGDGTGSNGFFQGVAPGASLVGLGVGDGAAIIQALSAYEYIFDNPALDIRVVNNSFGPVGDDNRFDSKIPLNQVSKKLNDERGVLFVWAAGNSGSTDPEAETAPGEKGSSDCSTREQGGERVETEGSCLINTYSVAPWAVSVAAGRKADPNTVQTVGGPGEQFLGSFSSRGDFRRQTALSGEEIDYIPTLTAPGVNVRAPRNPQGDSNVVGAFSAEPPAAQPPRNNPQDEGLYLALSGTSMSSPHVAGAAAVVQSAAKAKLGRFLTPAEVKKLLAESAAPMPAKDLFYDFPCGSSPIFIKCGERAIGGMTGQPYQAWQVGTGYLDMPALIARVDTLAQASAQTPPVPPPPPAACGDSTDNDGDGRADFPMDRGCTSTADTDESDPPQSAAPPAAPCDDGRDNDGDGKIDTTDPGCAGPADADETDGTLPPKAAADCLPPAPKISRRGIGPIRIGDTRGRAVRRAGAPTDRTARTFTYCVRGGGRVTAAFSKAGRIDFIGSSVTRGARRGLQLGGPVSQVRRFYGKLLRLDRDLVAGGLSKRIAFGVRRGRVTFVSVYDRSTLKTRAQVRRQRRLAGF